MAAGAISAQTSSFTGLRPVHLRQDLASIADLIEYCFAPTLDAGGRSAIHEMRLISRSGPLLWLFGRALPGPMKGFVWIDKGRLVGNVTVSPAGGRGWIIANVAVYPDYRRHGIARRLMLAALDQVARHNGYALLQVEADNTPARRLYDSLGFQEQRTFTRWRRATYYATPLPPPTGLELRPLARHETNHLFALAAHVRPNDRGGLGWLRPTTRKSLRPARWGWLNAALSGKNHDFWVLPGTNGDLDAALITENRLGISTVLFDLLVSSSHQGQLETPLLYEAIRRLGGNLQPLVTEHPADDLAAADALRQTHFRPERTLVHMIWYNNAKRGVSS